MNVPGFFSASAKTLCFSDLAETGKSHLAQAIAQAAILQGYHVLYRETHVLLDELADVVADAPASSTEMVSTVPLPILDDFGTRKLPHTAAEDLLERSSCAATNAAATLLTSNRPVEDWGKLLGDIAAASAILDRLLHQGHVLKCGPRNLRTQSAQPQGYSLEQPKGQFMANSDGACIGHSVVTSMAFRFNSASEACFWYSPNTIQQ